MRRLLTGAFTRVVLASVLAGCALKPPAAPAAPAGASPVVATTPPRAAAPPASGVPPGTPQPAGPPAAGNQPLFAAVIRDAKKFEGLLTLYQREEKVWIELKPEDFNKPLFLSPKLATGIGEPALAGGMFDSAQVIEFRRVHNQVQMVARNTRYTATNGTPEGRALGVAFSPSLMASATVASQPNPATNGVLVEANALFLNDLLALGFDLQRTYRQGYAFDARNSAITGVRAKPDLVVLQVLAHYATGSISPPQAAVPPGQTGPSVPRSLADVRSMFANVHYVISPLPATPMAPRASDARIGHFATLLQDFGNDVARSPTLRYVDRWRLEKKDPAAALSDPVKPLVYWLDRTLPLKYRDVVTSAILEWNKAFERVGLSNAIEVKVQPEDADFDTLDTGFAAVRWTTNSVPIGDGLAQKHVDPRSGEILSASVNIESFATREQRTLRTNVLGAVAGAGAGADDASDLFQPPRLDATGMRLDPHACTVADVGAAELGYGLDVLAARDELAPDGPQAQQFVLGYLRWLVMHEVGHTLGLRHNFRASQAFTDGQLSDLEFTRANGIVGSVMDYVPANLSAPGAKPVQAFQTTLGPYDYWAIEYAYRPLAPEDEARELQRIAARSNEPALAFGTDEDNFLGIDPDALQWDLGSDSVAFAIKRLAIAHELFKRQEVRALPPDRDYAVLRRSLSYAVNDAGRSLGVLARRIGGVRTLRDFPGSGRDPLQPVPAAQQREALDVIARGLLVADAFVVSPALQRRLAPDFQVRGDGFFGEGGGSPTDFSLTLRVLAIQRALLLQLMSDAMAVRIIDSQGKASSRRDAFQLSELYGRLERDIWSEIEPRAGHAARDIPAPRRELQREHLNRIVSILLRPSSFGLADARSLVRAQAQVLHVRVQAASLRAGLAADTRAHLQDCADSLAQALQAKVFRPGV